MTVEQNRRRRQRNEHGIIPMRPATFDEGDVHTASHRFEGYAPRGRRGRPRRGGQPKQEQQRFSALRGKMQAAQRLRANLLQPEQQGASRARAKNPLRRPQRIGRRL
jgi:hypothetical protein